MPETLTGPAAVDAFLATVPEPVGALAKATVAKLRAVVPPKAEEALQGTDIAFSFGSGYKSLMFTVTGSSFTLAPPFEISMPDEVQAILSGVDTAGGAISTVNPPAPGRSLRVSVTEPVLITFCSATAGEAGHSPVPQKHPLQIG